MCRRFFADFYYKDLLNYISEIKNFDDLEGDQFKNYNIGENEKAVIYDGKNIQLLNFGMRFKFQRQFNARSERYFPYNNYYKEL